MFENQYLQLHLLTSYPPANLNRDDLGRPKTAMMGGVQRLRVSSQSLKRAWRMSEVFEAAVAGNKGTRTRDIGKLIAARLSEKGAGEKNARTWAREMAGQFGKLREGKDSGGEKGLQVEQLVHFSPTEIETLFALADRLVTEDRAPTTDELDLLTGARGAADIALFGRMLASTPKANVEAAAQVAHALGVHRSAVEDDFFTAVDDINIERDEIGAGHMGEIEFGAGLFYLYICIDRRHLFENLAEDRELTTKTLAALVECAATVAPSGKQNTFGSRAYASYLLAELGNRQPRSLSVAFLNPVIDSTHGMLSNAVKALESTQARMDQVYGACADRRASFDVDAGKGTLQDVLDLCAAA